MDGDAEDSAPRVSIQEMNRRAMRMPDAASPVPISPPIDVDLPDTDDIRELCRAAVPGLVRKAVALAHGSNKLETVMSALKELLDRGYGKPEQSVNIGVKYTAIEVIRRGEGLPVIEVGDEQDTSQDPPV